MPTTSYTDFTAAARGITGRTNATGAAVTDYTAEEDRLVNTIMAEGSLTPNAFKVAASAGMVLTVGSGAAKADLYAVAGDASGQSTYLVRLETATVNVTVPASDPSQVRTDEIYLIVLDSPYDSNTLGTASAPLSLPRIGYRKGDAGGAAPGPDGTWKASVKLATITVDPTVTTIAAGKIADNRASSSLNVNATGLVEETWHTVGGGGEPAFAASASNMGSGYQTMQFKKVGNAVRIRGVVNAFSDVFTLPVGYRPPLALNFPVNSQNAPAAGTDLFGEILTTGVLSIKHAGGSGAVSSVGINVEFWVD